MHYSMNAQEKGINKSKNDKPYKVTVHKNSNLKKTIVKDTITEVSLTNNANYNAYASKPARNNKLMISDPVLRAMNARSNAEVKVISPAISGLPKGTFGFANGHIRFYSTGSTSAGGITGSGSVGAGSSPGSIGTDATAILVNGKSPYAGPAMWGTAITSGDISPRDSSLKFILIKKRKQ
jgi:hypothetical protein